ncbi:MAG: HD domain-containing phosphohydrolase [Bacillota bacterium]
MDDLLEQVLDIAGSVLGTVTCALYLAEEDGTLTLKTQRGLAPEAWPPAFQAGEGLIGTVAKQQRPLIVPDINQDSRVVHREHLLQHGMKQFFGIPLLVEGKTVGVLAAVDAPVDRLDADREEFLMLLAHQIASAVHKAALSRNLRESYLDTIRTLAAAIDAKDSYTRGHSERVCRYAVAIAQEMNLDAAEIERIENAALLHDIGKIGIADAILSKPARLTDEEYAVIQTHPAQGLRILEPVDTLQNILDYVLCHHERYDGYGYPGGAQGETIPLGARILCVADSFDAMTSGRPYQKARSIEAALNELWLCAGQQFDPQVVAAFDHVCERNPALFGGAYAIRDR